MAAVLRFHTRIAIVHGCLQDFEIAECVKEKRNASFITLRDNGLLDPAAGIAKFEGEYLEGSNESQKTLRASINNVWQFLESAPTSSAAEQSDTLPFHLRSKFLVAKRTRGFLSLDSQAVCSLDEKLPPSELSPKIRKPDWTEVHPWFAKCATLNRLLIASIICVVFYFSWMLNPIAFMQWINAMLVHGAYFQKRAKCRKKGFGFATYLIFKKKHFYRHCTTVISQVCILYGETAKTPAQLKLLI